MRTIAVLATALLLIGTAPTMAAEPSEGRPSVVVTTEVLGSVVTDLVGDTADVQTLMSGGADPHSWQLSARDSEAIFGADLIVANGLGLEEGLLKVLEQAEAEGVAVFRAAEHVDGRAFADGDTDPDHGDGSADPHFWLDPLAMRDVVLALGPVMIEAGVDLGDRADAEAVAMEALDVELRDRLSSIPDEQRRLVTGHSALGYFADAYDFETVGTVVPGLSSSDEPSARDIADLVKAIRASGATAVFTDVGTPQSVAATVAGETGTQVVELQVAQVPEGGTYADLLRNLASAVADALTP